MIFPLDLYKNWIRFREGDIYAELDLLEKSEENEEKTAKLEFLDSIWNNVLLINYGLDNVQLNYLLFTHLLILQSQYIFNDIYKKYDIANIMANPLYVTTSVSDNSTSSSGSIIGSDDLDLTSVTYITTPFGIQYLSLLKQIQSLVVIL